MNIGTLVWQDNQGNLRIGTITGKELDEKGWAWFTVGWHDDGDHKRATDWTTKLRSDGVDRYDRTYRTDELTVVKAAHLSTALALHMEDKIRRIAGQQPALPAC